jgi:signal transduction histidine kinase
MQGPIGPATLTELAAALLQAAITLGLAILCALLYRRHRKAYFRWWAIAWSLYLLRLVAIMSFLVTSRWHWLYWHQVATGWTALALLWAALVFLRQLPWRRVYLALLLFPPVWSYVAIYRLDDFLLAAVPSVLFLSLATLATGWVFLRYARRVRSTGAGILAASFLLWGLHHLDYPFLRAQGALSPWGYYLDIMFTLATGAAIMILVVDDLRGGLSALAALSGDLQREADARDDLGRLLERPLALPAVRGSAMCAVGEGGARCVRGAGVCAEWEGLALGGEAADAVARAISTARPQFVPEWGDLRDAGRSRFGFAAVLPVFRGSAAREALVIVGDARDPFTALDEGFLVALGQQIGAALEAADLTRRLASRTAELEWLSTKMLANHEEERRRISLELHDETAQLFSAVKLRLGVLRERADPSLAQELERAAELIDEGIHSIRSVVNDLRPSLLDDLGLLPALRSLAAAFEQRTGVAVDVALPDGLPTLGREADLGLFRALQESLSNVAQHAEARRVEVRMGVGADGRVTLEVRDDGRGYPGTMDFERLERDGHLGLAGMRERIGSLGGVVEVQGAPGGGMRVRVTLPAGAGAREEARG